jgi:predicted cupin superfamily sugar epimerase
MPPFSVLGYTVAPGFCFEDFEMGGRENWVAQFPGHRAWVEALTRLS